MSNCSIHFVSINWPIPESVNWQSFKVADFLKKEFRVNKSKRPAGTRPGATRMGGGGTEGEGRIQSVGDSSGPKVCTTSKSFRTKQVSIRLLILFFLFKFIKKFKNFKSGKQKTSQKLLRYLWPLPKYLIEITKLIEWSCYFQQFHDGIALYKTLSIISSKKEKILPPTWLDRRDWFLIWIITKYHDCQIDSFRFVFGFCWGN